MTATTTSASSPVRANCASGRAIETWPRSLGWRRENGLRSPISRPFVRAGSKTAFAYLPPTPRGKKRELRAEALHGRLRGPIGGPANGRGHIVGLCVLQQPVAGARLHRAPDAPLV